MRKASLGEETSHSERPHPCHLGVEEGSRGVEELAAVRIAIAVVEEVRAGG